MAPVVVVEGDALVGGRDRYGHPVTVFVDVVGAVFGYFRFRGSSSA